jgi:hypothetical protein
VRLIHVLVPEQGKVDTVYDYYDQYYFEDYVQDLLGRSCVILEEERQLFCPNLKKKNL